MIFKDPVCGFDIRYCDELLMVEYEGQKNYFCTESCRDRFVQAPELYVHQATRSRRGTGQAWPINEILMCTHVFAGNSDERIAKNYRVDTEQVTKLRQNFDM